MNIKKVSTKALLAEAKRRSGKAVRINESLDESNLAYRVVLVDEEGDSELGLIDVEDPDIDEALDNLYRGVQLFLEDKFPDAEIEFDDDDCVFCFIVSGITETASGLTVDELDSVSPGDLSDELEDLSEYMSFEDAVGTRHDYAQSVKFEEAYYTKK